MNLLLITVTIVLVALCVLGLGVQTFFSSRRRFPSTHIHDNPALRRRGIDCALKCDLGADCKMCSRKSVDNG